MRYFLDCEFYERGPSHPIELISLALVPDEGSPLYIVNADFKMETASQWLKDNVAPHLYAIASEQLSHNLIGARIAQYIGANKPEFWGYFADYDWVLFCQTFGTMLDLPRGWPHYCRDVQQLNSMLEFRVVLPPKRQPEHNALVDALWTRDVFRSLFYQGSLAP